MSYREETTETLHLSATGCYRTAYSGYTVRPPEARLMKPKFPLPSMPSSTRILALEPDLGFRLL